MTQGGRQGGWLLCLAGTLWLLWLLWLLWPPALAADMLFNSPQERFTRAMLEHTSAYALLCPPLFQEIPAEEGELFCAGHDLGFALFQARWDEAAARVGQGIFSSFVSDQPWTRDSRGRYLRSYLLPGGSYVLLYTPGSATEQSSVVFSYRLPLRVFMEAPLP